MTKTEAIVAITGRVKLQQNWGEVVLETLDSQLILNSENFVGETLCVVVEGCLVALM
jgi:hypothetical protein